MCAEFEDGGGIANQYVLVGQFLDGNNAEASACTNQPYNASYPGCVSAVPAIEQVSGQNANETAACADPQAHDNVHPGGLLAKLGLPCQNGDNYDYGQCYSYYVNGCYNTCQFVKFGDIEDFMNNEKRKEKSRDAARSRRSRETEIFTDLGNALPLSTEQISHLDKASVMRLAISYLRVRDMISLVDVLPVKEKLPQSIKDESAFLKSLEGFLLVLSPDGDFIYLSDNVSEYLGIPQVDLMGQNVFEYSHPCDHDEIRDILASKTPEDSQAPKSFFIRLKCTLTSKGRSVNLKSATYKVIHCTGHIVKENENEGKKSTLNSCLIAVGQPIPHPTNIDTPLPRQTFLTKHGLDMKFTDADDEFMMDILGYTSEDLIGKSVYDYHHAIDSDAIGTAFKCLFSKGQCETNRYRFLAKTGGYVWVVTQATLIYDKVHKPQSVVCVNYVISGVECKHEIYAAHQLASVKSEPVAETKNIVDVPADVRIEIVDVDEKVVESPNPSPGVQSNKQISSPTSRTKPISVTAKLFSSYEPTKDAEVVGRSHTATKTIFAPRTKDMSKGFLTFSEEEPGLTMLKDEPDDLTHLAPVAGDVCVPLDDHPFLTDMLDDFLLKDNSFGPLLNDEPSDPFISYRDYRDSSPQLLSPNLSKGSDCSLSSLCSPNNSLIDEDQMSTFINLHMDDDPDLIMKAPYIPMNFSDDLPLLMSNDLMWNNNEKNLSPNRIPENNSTLAQMLSSSVNKHSLKSSDRGGGTIEETDVEIYNEKNKSRNWSTKLSPKMEVDSIGQMDRSSSLKRSNTSSYDHQNKRTKNEPKEKMSSELLQQLMSNNHHRGRPKSKENWLLNSGSKAACISQPSDSVLMNLLSDEKDAVVPRPPPPILQKTSIMTREKLLLQLQREKFKKEETRRKLIRKNSLSLLEPEASSIPSLLDLTQQDCEVNAPVNSLLQGEELLIALDITNM